MRLTQRYNQESALLLFNLVCRSIVYHTSYYSIMNNRTWKPGDANDLNDQKKSRVTYGNGFAACNEYDPLGQLIRVNDQSDTTAGTDGTTWTYEYDCGGNILSKSRYEYTPGTLGTAQETVTYSYTDANWRDKLTGITTTNITGTTVKSISYDAIGNPTNDGEWTYTWENGRQLKQMEKGTAEQAGYMKVEYRYNSEGLRIQKIVTQTTATGTTATTTDYILHGKNIVHMIQGSDQLHFFYDASGKPAIVEYNGTKYGYIHNLQGDVVGIIDSTGTEVVKYTYDAWGKKLAVSGTLAGSLGVINPFRYRGYVYDVETELYYLRSRYYKHAWLRFICEDNPLVIISSSSLLNANLFSYCSNEPVQRIDEDGELWLPDLSWPGEIHKVVQLHIVAESNHVIKMEVGILQSNGNVGRIDLINTITGECWEVKSALPSFYSIMKQFKKYLNPQKYLRQHRTKQTCGSKANGNMI